MLIKTIRKMIKKIEISEETLKSLKNGKCVEGSIHIEKESGKIVFKAWNRKSPKSSKNRETVFQEGVLYVVRGNWRHRTWGDNNDRHENMFYISDIQTL